MMAATCFKQVGAGAKKDWGSCAMLLKHLFGKFHRYTGSLITSDSIMIENKKGIPETLSRSQARIG